MQELFFEGAHQPMKCAFAQSNMKNSQVQTMEHRLANDWNTRLAIEAEDVDGNGDEWSADSVCAVMKLLGHH